jgi:GTPase SAR1 family protein
MEGQSGRCKIVVVGDAECGKTALLQVFAKDELASRVRGSKAAGGG